ncbi:putative DNA binding domain-containing protein [Patescibacteria group bacterium]|nr:putative DNA binding domain-containing protein [Patescibacteria group bacterium]
MDQEELKRKLYELIQEPCEIEVLEFKTAENSFDFKELGKYFSALSNEANLKNQKHAWLIFGVNNKQEIVGTNYRKDDKYLQSLKHEIAKQVNNNISFLGIYSVSTDKGRVIMFEIPPASQNIPVAFQGHYYARDGESLVALSIGKFDEIRNQNKNIDWSIQVCEGVDIKDLDAIAINLLKQKWSQKSGNKEFLDLNNDEILDKLLLKNNNKITNACVLLLGSEKTLANHIPNSEFMIEWRGQEKMDPDFSKDIRKPFLLAYDEIWQVINARNIRSPFKQGFIELDIWAYSEQPIREAVLNAFAHREYFNRTEPVFIKFNPDNFKIKSPGGFIEGVTIENVLFAEGKWRNRFLMEVLAKIGLVERAGVGLDRIFKKSIKDGKGLPIFEVKKDDVVLNIPTKVRDINFVYFLERIAQEKQVTFNHIKDFLVLEEIRENGTSSEKEIINTFLKNNIIEKTGKTSGIKYLLSKPFYDFIDEKSEYTRKKWLSKEQQKQVLLNYFKQHKKGKMSDFKKLFEDKLTKPKINKLLSVLKDEDLIFLDGNPQSIKTFWRIKGQKGNS